MIKLLENFPKNVEQERIKNQLKLFLVANQSLMNKHI